MSADNSHTESADTKHPLYEDIVHKIEQFLANDENLQEYLSVCAFELTASNVDTSDWDEEDVAHLLMDWEQKEDPRYDMYYQNLTLLLVKALTEVASKQYHPHYRPPEIT